MTHRDDAMNLRCDDCEHLVRQCICELPYVKPLKSSHECRVCRHWLEGDWNRATTPEVRAEIQRQMDVGRCDSCTREAVLLK